MYFVSINEDNTIINLYSEDYADEDVKTYQITEEDFQKVWSSGRNGDWSFKDGIISHTPYVPPEPVDTTNP